MEFAAEHDVVIDDGVGHGVHGAVTSAGNDGVCPRSNGGLQRSGQFFAAVIQRNCHSVSRFGKQALQIIACRFCSALSGIRIEHDRNVALSNCHPATTRRRGGEARVDGLAAATPDSKYCC